MSNIGRRLSDVVKASKLSRRTLVEVLIKRVYKGFVIGENSEISTFDGVSNRLICTFVVRRIAILL